MHELIRQVTVECVERGELLSKLRERYATLINSIPDHMSSIYNRSLALQSMEHRLANKLISFKTRVSTVRLEMSETISLEKFYYYNTKKYKKSLKIGEKLSL